MNTPFESLHVWIFNDASVSCLLRPNSPLWTGFSPGILVELSSAPVIAHSLDLETPSGYPGIAGLLGSTHSPADLAITVPNLPIPAILSPSHTLSPAATIASIRRLRHDPRISGPRLLLVESHFVDDLLPLLSTADRLGVVWDLSTPPGAELQHLLSLFTAENLQRPALWAGLLGYFSPDHNATSEELAAASDSLSPLPKARIINL